MTERKKNILLLISTFAEPGGSQKFVSDLGTVLSEQHHVLECSFNAHDEQHVFRNRNTVLSLGVKARSGALQKVIGYVLKAYRLNRLKQQYGVDLTISNLWPSDFINALSMGRGKRVSIGLVNVIGNRQNRVLVKYRKAVGWIYRRFHKIVAINTDLMEELRALFELSPQRLACIYAFVALPEGIRAPIARSGTRRRVAWFGRLHRMKNLEPLFEVVASLKRTLPDTQLIVIGEGPHREELVAAARTAGLTVSESADESETDVVFLGFVSDPYEYLTRCDLLLLTSRSEGFGLVIVEAMSVGLPILASDCPTGGPHLIMEGAGAYRPGRTVAEETPYGYLLPVPEPGDATIGAIWTAAIADLLTDEGKRTIKGANSRQRATRFSRDAIKQQWLQLVDSL